MTKFWHVNQNNSGGSFDFNEEYGITHHLVIEAENANNASAIFNNLIDSYPDRGYDCPCCGDRWYDYFSESQGKDEPEVYGQPVAEYTSWISFMRNREDKEICVHYLDGRKEWFGIKLKRN